MCGPGVAVYILGWPQNQVVATTWFLNASRLSKSGSRTFFECPLNCSWGSLDTKNTPKGSQRTLSTWTWTNWTRPNIKSLQRLDFGDTPRCKKPRSTHSHPTHNYQKPTQQKYLFSLLGFKFIKDTWIATSATMPWTSSLMLALLHDRPNSLSFA